MKTLFNRIKAWIYVRRHHISEVRIERTEVGLELQVLVGDSYYMIDMISANIVSSAITDYGIAQLVDMYRNDQKQKTRKYDS